MNLVHRAGHPLGQTRPLAGHAHALLSRLFGGIEGLVARFIARRVEAAEIRTLLAFTDRELHDVGINRGDIPAIVRGDYRRN
jgi:uncharacterized protein YjiS (DUF1127 family)